MQYNDKESLTQGSGTYAVPIVVPAGAPHGQVIYATATQQPAPYNPAAQEMRGAPTRPPAPVGNWADGICDWPRNLFPSCWCAVCCCWGMYIQAQMAQKIQFANFQTVVSVTCVYWFVSLILQLVFPSKGIMYWMMAIFSMIFSILLRLRLVNRDNITTNGGCFSECCIGFWCYPCSIAQMARHLYGYTKVLDGDSDPFREDNYAHQV